MSFTPVPELLEELRNGRMIVVVDDEDRENEGDLIMAAQAVRPEDINFMAREARGLICLTLTRAHCRRLDLPLMVRDNRSRHSTKFTVSIEAATGVSTGISAHDRARTIQVAANPDAVAADLVQPGHIFPLMAEEGGVLVRAGHTEAGVDYMRLAGLVPAAVIVEVMSEDGSMARRPELETFAARHRLKLGSIEELIRHRLHTEHTVERVDTREIDTTHGRFTLATYRDCTSGGLHHALVHGRPDRQQPALVRVQPVNPLADVLRWRRDDFGPDIGELLARIAAGPQGALVLLDERLDNDALLARIKTSGDRGGDAAGGNALWRQNGVGSQILADLGFGRLHVIGTARKQVALAGFGLEIVGYEAP